MRLHLLHQQHDAQHNQRLHRPQGHERQKHRHGTGEQRTNHRDKGTQEHQHAQRNRQGHTQDGGAQADTDGINRGHQNLHADIGAQGLPARAARTIHGLARILGEETNDEQPDAFALHQEEKQREQG